MRMWTRPADRAPPYGPCGQAMEKLTLPHRLPTLGALAPTFSPLLQQRFMTKATAPAPAGFRIAPSSQAIRLRNTPANSRGDPTSESEKQQACIEESSPTGGVAGVCPSGRRRSSFLGKPRSGSLGRPARCRRGLRAREGEPGRACGHHDVPSAGRLPQRVLRVARPWALFSCQVRRGVAQHDSEHPPGVSRHLRGASGACRAGGRWVAGEPQAGGPADA